ncbi:hypothetical protein BDF14DRAFT_680068 [Spinellus fusiger]|nr:hypothetical protein BDF14DRAFT_680068 [Spinellus fusiger]
MVALTGWVLEYPTIYTTHEATDTLDSELDEWEVRNNCLGGCPLTVIRVWLTGLSHGPLAGTQSSQEKKQEKRATLQHHEHHLMSFSCPTSLWDEEQALAVCNTLMDRVSGSSHPWMKGLSVYTTKEHVLLDRVAL